MYVKDIYSTDQAVKQLHVMCAAVWDIHLFEKGFAPEFPSLLKYRDEHNVVNAHNEITRVYPSVQMFLSLK